LRRRRSGVDGHPHGDRSEIAPVLGYERSLAIDGGEQRVEGGRERGVDGVADGLEAGAVVGLDGGIQEREVPLDGRPHRRRVPFPAAGAPLDIGEEEGDSPAGQFAHGGQSVAAGIVHPERTVVLPSMLARRRHLRAATYA
jgi:hypothetical protein